MFPKIIDANTVFGSYPKRRVDASLNGLLKIMAENNVDKALTVSLRGAFYSYGEGNEETLKACEAHKNLVPVATIDPRRFTGDIGELEELVKRGFKAVRLFPEMQGYPLEYAPLIRILDGMEGLGIPLLTANQGFGYVTALSKMTRGKGYPVIVMGCSYGCLSEFIVLGRENRHLHLETHQLNTPDAFELLTSKVGADRLIFGSGAPLRYFKASYMMVETSGISEEDKSLILGGNISRLLGGDA